MLTAQGRKTVENICSSEQLIEVKRLIDEYNGGKNQKKFLEFPKWASKRKVFKYLIGRLKKKSLPIQNIQN